MKVLVTGATGFVGSWLTKSLVNLGHEVHILRRATSDLSEISDLNLVHHIGDITNLASLEKACENKEVIFHLAGLIAYSASQRENMQKINVGGTQNVITACENQNVKRLVYMSSVTAVGASFDGKESLNEDSLYNMHPLNLGYFETKHEAELCVIKAQAQNRIDSVILNPSTIYGPGDARKGSRKTQIKVAQGRFPFYTGGGVNVVNIKDVVEAIITAWQTGRSGERYILSGENITIKQLFTLIAEEAGVEPPKFKLPRFLLKAIGRIGDSLTARGRKAPVTSETAWTSTLFHWFDSTKAQNELNFKPMPAQESIRQSVQWMQEHKIL